MAQSMLKKVESAIYKSTFDQDIAIVGIVLVVSVGK